MEIGITTRKDSVNWR